MLKRERVDLDEVMRRVIGDFDEQLRAKRVTVDDRAHGEHVINGFAVIDTVFANLLSNAIKYSPEGKKIEMTIEPKDDRFVISIKDWGCSVRAEDIPKLFTRFSRVDREGVNGTGLGLAIVKRVADLHGGSVAVAANPEGGSIFSVEIPKG